MAAHRLMVVDDEQKVLAALRRVLAAPEREIECYHDPEEALTRARAATFDLFIADFRMPNMDGAELLGRCRELQPEAVRMIISAYADFESMVSALHKGGIERFIAKPWNVDEIQTAVTSALEKRDLLLENRRLAEELRRSRETVARQRDELERLERDHPGLTRAGTKPDDGLALRG